MALGFRPVFCIRSLMACSKRAGSMFQVSASLSTKTGLAPRYLTGFADAEKVKLWQMTSSPGPTPSITRPRCMADVPDAKATTWMGWSALRPCHPSKSFSNPSTFGPRGTTQLVSKACCTNSCSLPPMWARHNQILLMNTFYYLGSSTKITTRFHSFFRSYGWIVSPL